MFGLVIFSTETYTFLSYIHPNMYQKFHIYQAQSGIQCFFTNIKRGKFSHFGKTT